MDGDSRCVGRGSDRLDHLVDDSVDRAKTELEEKLPRDDPGDVEQVADEGSLHLCVALDRLDRVQETFALPRPCTDDLLPPQNRVQWPPHLMGDRGENLVL